MVPIKSLVHSMRGFTLIELMVTVTIIVLVTGASMAAYLTFNENRQLDNDARAFNTLISKIRSKATFLEYPDGCTGLNNFVLQIEDNTQGIKNKVTYYASCVSGNSENISEEILSGSEFTANFSIVFEPSTGNIQTGESVEVTIQSLKGTSRTKTITIDPFSNAKNVISDEN